MKVQSLRYYTDNRIWCIEVLIAESCNSVEVFADVLKQNKNGMYLLVGKRDTQPLYVMEKLQFVLKTLPVMQVDKLHIRGVKAIHSDTYRVNFNSRIMQNI